jgi:hypothetical protein
MVDGGETWGSKAKPRIKAAFFIIGLLKDMRNQERKKKKTTILVKKGNSNHKRHA